MHRPYYRDGRSAVPQKRIGDNRSLNYDASPLSADWQGVLQTDQEAPIRGLVGGLATYTGLSARQAPADSHDSQGTVERDQATLWQQVQALRETLRLRHPGLRREDGAARQARHLDLPPLPLALRRSGVLQAPVESYCPARHDTPKAEVRRGYRVWLGKCTQSDERYIGTAEGVLRAKDIKRLPKSER